MAYEVFKIYKLRKSIEKIDDFGLMSSPSFRNA